MSVIAGYYREGLERLLAVAAPLSETQAAIPVPACPDWTVKDVYSHQAGVADDVLAGRLDDGVATDPWTAAQVEARRGHSFSDVVAELDEKGHRFAEALAQFGDAADPRVVMDQWTHEQDVRGALGTPGGTDLPVLGWMLERLTKGFGRGWAEAGRPPVRVVGTSGEWLLGEGEPGATLRASDAELARIMIGRRSRRQALACWEGDGEPFVDHLVAFSFSRIDLHE